MGKILLTLLSSPFIASQARSNNPLASQKTSLSLLSIIDSLRMNGHSRVMVNKAINSKLIKTLFCVVLLISLVLYPPSSAHAHSLTHGAAISKGGEIWHHGGHDAHAHQDVDDVQGQLNATDGDTTTDTTHCCQGICMVADLAQAVSGLSDVQRADHEASWLSSFSPFDPIEHRRPPKHLI